MRGCIPSAYYESLCLGRYWMPGLKYDILGLKLYIVFTACLSRKIIGLYGHKSGKIPLFGFERLKFLILREWTSCSLSFFFCPFKLPNFHVHEVFGLTRLYASHIIYLVPLFQQKNIFVTAFELSFLHDEFNSRFFLFF